MWCLPSADDSFKIIFLQIYAINVVKFVILWRWNVELERYNIEMRKDSHLTEIS